MRVCLPCVLLLAVCVFVYSDFSWISFSSADNHFYEQSAIFHKSLAGIELTTPIRCTSEGVFFFLWTRCSFVLRIFWHYFCCFLQLFPVIFTLQLHAEFPPRSVARGAGGAKLHLQNPNNDKSLLCIFWFISYFYGWYCGNPPGKTSDYVPLCQNSSVCVSWWICLVPTKANINCHRLKLQSWLG